MADFGFRPVTRADLPLLADWLRLPKVGRWWRGADRQVAGIAKYLDEPAMRQWLVLSGETPSAYAQFYPAHHWNAPHFRHLSQDALAIDCFSGPAGFGQGAAWLRALSDMLLAEEGTLTRVMTRLR